MRSASRRRESTLRFQPKKARDEGGRDEDSRMRSTSDHGPGSAMLSENCYRCDDCTEDRSSREEYYQ